MQKTVFILFIYVFCSLFSQAHAVTESEGGAQRCAGQTAVVPVGYDRHDEEQITLLAKSLTKSAATLSEFWIRDLDEAAALIKRGLAVRGTFYFDRSSAAFLHRARARLCEVIARADRTRDELHVYETLLKLVFPGGGGWGLAMYPKILPATDQKALRNAEWLRSRISRSLELTRETLDVLETAIRATTPDRTVRLSIYAVDRLARTRESVESYAGQIVRAASAFSHAMGASDDPIIVAQEERWQLARELSAFVARRDRVWLAAARVGNYDRYSVIRVAADEAVDVLGRVEQILSWFPDPTIAHDGPQAARHLRERAVELIGLSEPPWGIAKDLGADIETFGRRYAAAADVADVVPAGESLSAAADEVASTDSLDSRLESVEALVREVEDLTSTGNCTQAAMKAKRGLNMAAAAAEEFEFGFRPGPYLFLQGIDHGKGARAVAWALIATTDDVPADMGSWFLSPKRELVPNVAFDLAVAYAAAAQERSLEAEADYNHAKATTGIDRWMEEMGYHFQYPNVVHKLEIWKLFEEDARIAAVAVRLGKRLRSIQWQQAHTNRTSCEPM